MVSPALPDLNFVGNTFKINQNVSRIAYCVTFYTIRNWNCLNHKTQAGHKIAHLFEFAGAGFVVAGAELLDHRLQLGKKNAVTRADVVANDFLQFVSISGPDNFFDQFLRLLMSHIKVDSRRRLGSSKIIRHVMRGAWCVGVYAPRTTSDYRQLLSLQIDWPNHSTITNNYQLIIDN